MCTLAQDVRLTRYTPSLRQRTHDHGGAHISLVLAGAFVEEIGRSEIVFGAGRVALRPEGMRHAGTFAPSGAVVLSCSFPVHAPEITRPRWSRPLAREHLRAVTPLLLGDKAEATEACWDLVALAEHDEPQPPPSPWIAAVRDQLSEAPGAANLSAIAAQAGRHRVHLGRAFLATFGETPSVFRRRAMLDRTLCLTARGVAPALAAAEAGFTDQSHFIRACRDVFGVAPGQLIRNTVDVASVQYVRA